MDPRVPAKAVYHTKPTKVYSSISKDQHHVDLGDILPAPATGMTFPVALDPEGASDEVMPADNS